VVEDRNKKKRRSNSGKPISLKPLKFDEAVSDLLKVKPQNKATAGVKRYRNNPPIRMIIQEYLTKHDTASFKEIYDYVRTQPIKLVSNKPENSVFLFWLG
jgi:hypothetical protein